MTDSAAGTPTTAGRTLLGEEAWDKAAQQTMYDTVEPERENRWKIAQAVMLLALDSLLGSGVLHIEYRTNGERYSVSESGGSPIRGTHRMVREQRLVSVWSRVEATR